MKYLKDFKTPKKLQHTSQQIELQEKGFLPQNPFYLDIMTTIVSYYISLDAKQEMEKSEFSEENGFL